MLLKKSFLSLALFSVALTGCASGNKSPGSDYVSDAYGQDTDAMGNSAVSISQDQYVPDRVFFSFDSAQVTAGGMDAVKLQAAFLKTILKDNGNVKVTVEGHCDERGTREYNIALGQRRAESMKRALLQEVSELSASQVNAVSYGKSKPAAAGSNAQAWAENRRSVLVIE